MVIYIKRNMCPFCKRTLSSKTERYSNNIRISCLHCEKCNNFYYLEKDYKLRKDIAFDSNQKLSKNVFEYRKVEPKKENVSKHILSNTTRKKSKKKLKNNSITQINSNVQKVQVEQNMVKDCAFYKNKKCQYFDDSCNPYSVRCRNPNILLPKTPINPHNETAKITSESQSEMTIEHYVKAIILTHNRKCIHEEHDLVDVLAILKILQSTGNIIDVAVPAVYCKECNQYIITKADFRDAKQKGVILCQVEDKTAEYLMNHKRSYAGTESRIHSLGYNVIKQYGYTYDQRKIILANIMENYNISKHEILSMIDTNISRKARLSNYEDAVNKWKQDRNFVVGYHTGDIPQVIVDKVTIGKRK